MEIRIVADLYGPVSFGGKNPALFRKDFSTDFNPDPESLGLLFNHKLFNIKNGVGICKINSYDEESNTFYISQRIERHKSVFQVLLENGWEPTEEAKELYPEFLTPA